jgi:hypothetical protein
MEEGINPRQSPKNATLEQNGLLTLVAIIVSYCTEYFKIGFASEVFNSSKWYAESLI